MNAFVPLPSQFRWTPQQLAGAIPLRLGDLLHFDADAAHGGARAAANEPRQRLRIAHGYRAASAPPPCFRIS